MTGIVDITAVALYMHYWGTFGGVPQWMFALIALGFVGGMNMVAVKLVRRDGILVLAGQGDALLLFLVVGIVLLATGHPVAGARAGPAPDHREWRHLPAWHAAGHRHHPGRRVRLCRHRARSARRRARRRIRARCCRAPSTV